MITINKNQEPRELLQYRQQSGVSFDAMDTVVKSIIKRKLLDEQGYLCCYCMKRISEADMKIEHWHSQSLHPQEQLDYENLLAVCPGKTDNSHHCDAKKGGLDLKYNPSDKNHPIENYLKYSGDGTIQSNNKEFCRQLKSVLNLNIARLISNRKAVINAVQKVLNEQQGTRTPKQIQSIIHKWKARNNDGHLNEYCGVAIYFLEKRLERKNGARQSPLRCR